MFAHCEYLLFYLFIYFQARGLLFSDISHFSGCPRLLNDFQLTSTETEIFHWLSKGWLHTTGTQKCRQYFRNLRFSLILFLADMLAEFLRDYTDSLLAREIATIYIGFIDLFSWYVLEFDGV